MISVEVKTSLNGPWMSWGYDYRPAHAPLRNGRIVSYWANIAALSDYRSGVAIIIRREP